nr:monofunctional biosynthetic peptidoglycan transglycosylase [uncultured Mucilaginibacter sp.]
MKGLGKLIWRFVKLALILFIGLSVLGVIAYRFINPPVTWLMITRGFERKADGKDWKIDKEWRDLDEMSPNMPRAAIAGEDGAFLTHHGFDFNAIERAAKKNMKGKKVIGGSTITQQTAKNVFLWSGRSWIRKGFEAYFTMLIEIFWSKERIMEVYLNVIEMGDGIYGVQAASQAYFHKDAKDLTRSQCAAIVSILPSPLRWSATSPSNYVRHRQSLIKQNMRRMGKLEFAP